MKPEIIIENTIDELVTKIAENFYELVNSSSRQINVALSGGSTPRKLFKKFATEYGMKMDWDKINFWWGDERCVPPDDNDSNYGMTKFFLLDKIVIHEHNIFRIHGESDPGWEAERYGKLMNEVHQLANGIPQFDLIYLGIGNDGHTASIFPDQIHLWDSPNNCVRAIHPTSNQYRVSITGRIINNAKEVVLLATGGNKKKVLKEILFDEEISNSYPAKLICPKSKNYKWFLDSSAAALISKKS
jgi:6-phosphogluconolactonase